MKYLISTALVSTIAFSSTTMCYKNNIKDISTVETKKFDGGECMGKYSIDDMKNNSWNISDIKISQKDDKYNFIYILKKQTKSIATPTVVNQKIDYNKINKTLKENKLKNKEIQSLKDGKRVYINKCQSCHGAKGEQTPYNTSAAINKFSLDKLKDTIRGYTMDSYNNGFAIIMKPYADLISDEDLENIYKYLKSINK